MAGRPRRLHLIVAAALRPSARPASRVVIAAASGSTAKSTTARLASVVFPASRSRWYFATTCSMV